MHEEAQITTSTTTKFSSNTLVNTTNLHQNNNEDGSIVVSIVHPHHSDDLGDFIASADFNASCSAAITNQIAPSQTKIIVSSNELQTLIKEDVSVIINGTISNSNDQNVLILPATETTCDTDKNLLSLRELSSPQADQVEFDLHDETSSREEGE